MHRSSTISHDVLNRGHLAMRLRWMLIIFMPAICAVLVWRLGPSHAIGFNMAITPPRLPADGSSSATLHATQPATFTIVSGQHAARIEGSKIVAGVLGGPVVVEARRPGFTPVRATLETVAQAPEQFLLLDDDADRA